MRINHFKSHTIRIAIYAFIFFISGFILAVVYKTIHPQSVNCPRCNVVIISIDPLRADNLPCFNYIYNTTPNLCRYANRNTLFTNAFAHSSWTLPSIMSMITSQYPYEHGMLVPYQSVLSPSTVTLPQALKNAGYHTIFVGDTKNSHLPLDKGLGRGFEVISEDPHEPKALNELIIQQNNSRKPFFMFIHNFDMSASWSRAASPPASFRFDTAFAPPKLYDPKVFIPTAWKDAIYYLEQKVELSENYSRILSLLKNSTSAQQAYTYFNQLSPMDQQTILSFSIFEYINMTNPTHIRLLRNLYDERLFMLDKSLASPLELLSSPPWDDNTIVIIVANHGDELGEHGRMSHGTNLFGSTTHIPLILHTPNTPPARINALVGSIDIFPTILEIIGVPKPKSIRGESLVSLVNKTMPRLLRDYVISQLGPFPWISSIRTPSWSYYKDDTDLPPEALFNLKTDPNEQSNIASQHGDVTKQLQKTLLQESHMNPAVQSLKSQTTHP